MSVIGLDVGTSQVKAVRFDEQRHQADVASETTKVLRTGDGRREQDLVEVRDAAFRVVREVASRSPDAVDTLAITAQGDGCWLVDSDGAPVGNALLWNDNRAADVVRDWLADGTLEAAFRSSGSLGAPGLANAQLRWLLDHEPETVDRADTLLSCGSWVFAALTGRHGVEASDAANPFCSARTGRYDDDLIERFGLTEQRRLLPEIVSGASAVGSLTDGAASELGLPEQTPVVLAPYDVVATAIGCGVAEPGSAFAVLGTTLCVGVAADDPTLDREPSGMTLPLGADRWLLAYATLTGTEALDWLARTLGSTDVEAVVRSASQSDREDLPLFLPYLSPAGERAPFLDPLVAGGFVGVRLDHRPEDLARSVLEGLTCAVVDCLDAARAAPEWLTVCGGGARSDIWCQLLADATGLLVRRPAAREVGALGATMYAAVARGDVADLRELSVETDPQEFTPHARATTRLREVYERTVTTRERLRAGG